MSPKPIKDSAKSPASPASPAKPESKVKRVSNPRAKKVPMSAVEAIEAIEEIPVSPISEPVVVDDKMDWPEPEAPSSGGDSQSPSESTKRKRRRRKGKGGANQANTKPASQSDSEAAAVTNPPVVTQAPQQAASSPKPKLDINTATKMAWKIFLAEVSEEGVALINDQDARELSKRCFRLAEIFIDEQSRRR